MSFTEAKTNGNGPRRKSMLSFLKPMSPGPLVGGEAVDNSASAANPSLLVNSYLKSSSCTSPDNSSLENAATSKEIDQL